MDATYIFLQQYWWFLVSLLGALLVFLLFVQGGNSLLFTLGRTEEERTMLVNSTGRKWEFTFTTLVTFGGAFFASFPLFYSTSFGGAYWLWMIILFSFVLQAVSYEFQSKLGNLLGKRTYQRFLVLNGVVGPLLLGAAVATFFNGSNFMVSKGNLTDEMMPVISQWANGWHGLDAFADPWNLVLGFAVVPETGEIYMEPFKYFHNLLAMPYLLVLFLLGVAGVLWGIGKSIFCKQYVRGIWPAGIGTVLTVLALLLTVGYNHTAYYPSTADLQSSLTLANSCSSQFTLTTMAYVSVLVPFVLAYIIYAWRAIDRKPITADEMKEHDHTY